MVTPLNLTLFHQDKTYGNSQDPTVPKYYGTFVNEKCADLFPNEKPVGANDTWNKVKTTLLYGADEVSSWNRGGRVRHAQTWWCNDNMDQYIKEKQRLWKMLKMGGFEEDYLAARSVLSMQYTMLKRFQKKIDSLRLTLKMTATKSSN